MSGSDGVQGDTGPAAGRPSDVDLLQLSDTHLRGDGRDAVAETNLRRLVDRIVDDGLVPRLLVLTGDLSDDGTAESYRRLDRFVEPIRAAGAGVVFVPGNHDDGSHLSAQLLGDLLGGDGGGETDSLCHTVGVPGVEVLVLDTTVPGSDRGRIDRARLGWLRGRIDAVPAGTRAVVAMHHPPIPPFHAANLPYTLDDDSRAAFAALIAEHPVDLVLAGHYHFQDYGMLAGVPVAVSGSSWSNRSRRPSGESSHELAGAAVGNVIRFGAGVSIAPLVL